MFLFYKRAPLCPQKIPSTSSCQRKTTTTIFCFSFSRSQLNSRKAVTKWSAIKVPRSSARFFFYKNRPCFQLLSRKVNCTAFGIIDHSHAERRFDEGTVVLLIKRLEAWIQTAYLDGKWIHKHSSVMILHGAVHLLMMQSFSLRHFLKFY